MYLNMSATMIPRYAHKMVNVAPQKHIYPQATALESSFPGLHFCDEPRGFGCLDATALNGPK